MTTPVVLMAGNPNAGKTTLFNALTGARAKVGNYPGITVERVEKTIALPDRGPARFVDLPGTYSLTSRSEEERIAVEALLAHGSEAPHALVVVVDATSLRRGLYLATQLIDTGVPAVIALTMMDDAKKLGLDLDAKLLGEALGASVVPLCAPRGEGTQELLSEVAKCLAQAPREAPLVTFAEPLERAIQEVAEHYPGAAVSPLARRVRGQWALLSIGDDELSGISDELRRTVRQAQEEHAHGERSLEEALISERYDWVDRAIDRALVAPGKDPREGSHRIDSLLMHPLWGMLSFLLVMFLVFQTLFAWSEPFVALIEDAVNGLKGWAKTGLPSGPFTDLLSEGVIAGVGNVLVFVPQIALLFVFLTVLEDSGYLARVAFVIDRVMAKVGLNGRAFVPMLSGFACAIPAVMAARTIESRRDRLLTMLVVPLSSCSARLPVYALVTAVVFDAESKVLGLLSVGALVLFAMYLLSVVASLTAAYVIGRTVLKGPRPTHLLELPSYRWPRARNVADATWDRVKRFFVDAGTVILALTIVLWGLLNYPQSSETLARFEAERAAAAQITDDAERSDKLAAIEAEASGARLRESIAGRVGHAIEPALAPLGFDWKIGVGILGAFAAREVFVSTLGLVYDVSEADEENPSLRAALKAARHPDGRAVFTPLSGVALMVFFVLACQCMSTLAVVKRESGSWRWALFMLGYMTVLAYVATLVVYQGGRLLGFS